MASNEELFPFDDVIMSISVSPGLNELSACSKHIYYYWLVFELCELCSLSFKYIIYLMDFPIPYIDSYIHPVAAFTNMD